MQEKGYTCIETESYDNLYKLFKDTNKEYSLADYELNITSLYRYCVFEKTECKVVSVLSNKVEMVSTSKNLIEHKNLEFYRVHSSYDIYNILNCINFTVFKKLYENTQITSFNDILKSLNVLKIHDKIVPYFDGQAISNNSMVYFYNHYHEEQHEQHEQEEPVIINQFYIILYKGNITQTMQTIKDIQTLWKELPKQEIKQEELKETPKQEVKETPKEDKKIRIKSELAKLGSKVTMVILKEYLKELNMKTSGKKDELLERLNQYIQSI
jgi:hypothetical protein